MSPAIRAFMAACLAQEWLPYVWPTSANDFSGKGSPNCDYPEGRDCSGFVSVSLRAAGDTVDRRDGWNAERYWLELEKVSEPQAGDFAVYGNPERATHMMVCWTDGRVYGACGGNSDVTDVGIARARRACVRFKHTEKYRPDLLGYLKNPIREMP